MLGEVIVLVGLLGTLSHLYTTRKNREWKEKQYKWEERKHTREVFLRIMFSPTDNPCARIDLLEKIIKQLNDDDTTDGSLARAYLRVIMDNQQNRLCSGKKLDDNMDTTDH